MKLSVIFVVIAAILTSGNCTICYQCVQGNRSNGLELYRSCNRFLENHTCNTSYFSSSCVTYISKYPHNGTIVYDCLQRESPMKDRAYETRLCTSNYCNRGDDWGHYSKASSVTLQNSLGIILMMSLFFLN